MAAESWVVGWRGFDENLTRLVVLMSVVREELGDARQLEGMWSRKVDFTSTLPHRQRPFVVFTSVLVMFLSNVFEICEVNWRHEDLTVVISRA